MRIYAVCTKLILGFSLSITSHASNTWSLVFGGDLMLSEIPASSKPLSSLAQLLKEADVRYANLEIPLTYSNTPTSKKSLEELKRKAQFVLKADPEHICHLKELGFNMLSLGNNHIMDYGPVGMRNTVRYAEKHGIKVTGAGENEAEAAKVVTLLTHSGKRIGMISYLAFMGSGALDKCTPAKLNNPGTATLNFGGIVDQKAASKIQNIVSEAKKNCDFLIVALHWGLEKRSSPTSYQVQLGRSFIDKGADLVLGSHPHVLQGAEQYKGKPIFYSLGNLVSPRPGNTGIFKIIFEKNQPRTIQIFPLQISNSKLRIPLAQKANDIVSYFSRLCENLQIEHPGPNSLPIKLSN